MPRFEATYIWPPEGVAAGETEVRTEPLEGYFAVKFKKHGMSRALSVTKLPVSGWSIYLDGSPVAAPNNDWRAAFGHIWHRAQAAMTPILTGRKLSYDEYKFLVNARQRDIRDGIDLDDDIDLNTTKPAI